MKILRFENKVIKWMILISWEEKVKEKKETFPNLKLTYCTLIRSRLSKSFGMLDIVEILSFKLILKDVPSRFKVDTYECIRALDAE